MQTQRSKLTPWLLEVVEGKVIGLPWSCEDHVTLHQVLLPLTLLQSVAL